MSASRRATPVDVVIGANIRRARIQRGMTQGQLAARLGMHPQNVAKYEGGQLRVPASRLIDISEATGFSPSALCQRALEGEGDINTPEIAALVRDYARLSRAKRQAVRTLLSALLPKGA